MTEFLSRARHQKPRGSLTCSQLRAEGKCSCHRSSVKAIFAANSLKGAQKFFLCLKKSETEIYKVLQTLCFLPSTTRPRLSIGAVMSTCTYQNGLYFTTSKPMLSRRGYAMHHAHRFSLKPEQCREFRLFWQVTPSHELPLCHTTKASRAYQKRVQWYHSVAAASYTLKANKEVVITSSASKEHRTMVPQDIQHVVDQVGNGCLWARQMVICGHAKHAWAGTQSSHLGYSTSRLDYLAHNL